MTEVLTSRLAGCRADIQMAGWLIQDSLNIQLLLLFLLRMPRLGLGHFVKGAALTGGAMAMPHQQRPIRRRQASVATAGLVMCIVFVLFLGFALYGEAQDDAGCGGDAADTEEDAFILDGDGSWSGMLGDKDKNDWYAIDLTRGTILSVRLSFPDTIDLDLFIDPVGAARPNAVRIDGLRYHQDDGFGIDEILGAYAVENAGLCYLSVRVHRVKRPYNQVCTYTLTVETQQQDDAGTDTDASDSKSHADILLAPGTYTGTLLSSDDADWYVVDCDQGQLMSVWLTYPTGTDFHLAGSSSPWFSQQSDQEEFRRYVVVQDRQLLGIYRQQGGGVYELRIEIENQDDGGSGADAFPIGYLYDWQVAPIYYEEEVFVVHRSAIRGFLGNGDDADWYAVEMHGNDTLTLDLSVPEGARMQLQLYRPGGRQPCEGGVYGSGDHVEVISKFASRPGTYFFTVERIEGSGTYAVSLGRSYGEGGIGIGGKAVIPRADGVSIPFLRKDPAVESGSTCRGACGSGCPDTCQARPDIIRCLPDPNDENAHVFVNYADVIECGTHLGCRMHDDCFDECYDKYGEESVIAPCHDACSAFIAARFGPKSASWALGYGPYDGYYLYSDLPEQTDPELGQLEFTEYRVDVYTGSAVWRFGEGTDARVYLTLIGTLFDTPRCSSGEIRLDTPDYNDFETGQHDSFVVEGEAFDSLQGIVLRHDNTGEYPGWYVDRVVITNLANGKAWQANAGRWIAIDEEDYLLRVEFSLNGL